MGWNYLSIAKLQRLHRWSLGMDKWFHPTLYNECNYLSMLGLKQWPLGDIPSFLLLTTYLQNLVSISVTLHEWHSVSNQRQLDSLFMILLKPTTKKTSKPRITLCERNPHVKGDRSQEPAKLQMWKVKCHPSRNSSGAKSYVAKPINCKLDAWWKLPRGVSMLHMVSSRKIS